MTIFLTLMWIGLAGLVLMAIPGLGRHGHAALGARGHGGPAPGSGHGLPAAPAPHSALPAAHLPSAQGAPSAAHGLAPGHAGPAHSSLPVPRHVPPGAGQAQESADAAPMGLPRLLPSPRGVFTILALFGALGYALVASVHLAPLLAGLAAVVPSVLFERLVATPLFNLLFQFQGKPSSPLYEVLLDQAVAVTPFRNGKGVVEVIRDGRTVQLSAHLKENQAALPVAVGDRLKIEDVDEARERVTVSVE